MTSESKPKAGVYITKNGRLVKVIEKTSKMTRKKSVIGKAKPAAKISGAGKSVPKKAKAPAEKKTVASKKKLGNAKAKPATKKVAKAAGDHWFDKLTKKAQAEYIKAHPNSKFAKGAKKVKASATPKAAVSVNHKAELRKIAREIKKTGSELKKTEKNAEHHSNTLKTAPAHAKRDIRAKRDAAKDKASLLKKKHKELSKQFKNYKVPKATVKKAKK